MRGSGAVEVKRRTRETEIELKLALAGQGRAHLSVEPYFLKHMLETFVVHAGADLELDAQADDEHHLIEDVGISLGRAIRKAIPEGNMERMAHVIVPMDDALVLTALDLIDRPFAAVELPDPMYAHMLRSMALEARVTLHVRRLAGEDSHHIVEAAFKGLGRALRAAALPQERDSSAKGEVTWE